MWERYRKDVQIGVFHPWQNKKNPMTASKDDESLAYDFAN